MITLGLAEVWFQKRLRKGREAADGDAQSGGKGGGGGDHGGEEEEEEEEEEALWRAVPSDRFDPTRHGFRVSSVQENLQNLRAMVALIRQHVPEAVVVFTRSSLTLTLTLAPTLTIPLTLTLTLTLKPNPTSAPTPSQVFTLSPVPLSATFRGVSCVTANAVSKSILRVAVGYPYPYPYPYP